MVTLPEALRKLPPDRLELVFDLALEIARASEAMPGLTAQQSKLVRVLQKARGACVSFDALSQAISKREGDPVSYKLAQVQVCRLRKARPDIGKHIKTVWGNGLRWEEHPE